MAPITDGNFVLEDALGNTLTITKNGPFTFATPYALNDTIRGLGAALG